MYRIIDEQGNARYGCIDEPVDFNATDFVLRNFFGKEIRGWRKKIAFHNFNYIGIITDHYLLGIAAVHLGYMANSFAYLYDYHKGVTFEFDKKMLPGTLTLPANPDEHVISWRSGSNFLNIRKSHREGLLELETVLGKRLEARATIPFSLKKNNPLRVLNPSCGDPYRFTYTEKCSPLIPEKLEVKLDGAALRHDPAASSVLYDWSGGYLNRNTNWYWAAFSGFSGKKSVGANFAALVNETFYPENAFWINGRRTRVSRCFYDFDAQNPYSRPWKIVSDTGNVELVFHPEGERAAKINAGPVAKTEFRQFFGRFNGVLRPDSGGAVTLKDVRGFTENHRAIW